MQSACQSAVDGETAEVIKCRETETGVIATSIELPEPCPRNHCKPKNFSSAFIHSFRVPLSSANPPSPVSAAGIPQNVPPRLGTHSPFQEWSNRFRPIEVYCH